MSGVLETVKNKLVSAFLAALKPFSTQTGGRCYDQGKLHREGGPASFDIDPKTGIMTREEWYKHGALHRDDGPAIIERDSTTGEATFTQWWKDGRSVESEVVTIRAKPAGLAAHIG